MKRVRISPLGVRCEWCDELIVKYAHPRSAYRGRNPPPRPWWVHETSGSADSVDADGALHDAEPRKPVRRVKDTP